MVDPVNMLIVPLSPAGQLLQGIDPHAPEADVITLTPLVHFLHEWRKLPNLTPWLLRTIEKGYRIQFAVSPPKFKGVFCTEVSSDRARVLEQEVQSLLMKGAIEYVSPHESQTGFYSRYFIVPKKDGGLRPILDLRYLNKSLRRYKFKMLTIPVIVAGIRKGDWFTTIDLKDAYFHISILPQHR
ncbi:MAG: hypothetical protein ACRC7D_09175, partial [Aeromonas popoffii]|uniref:hypothetical protein n=1 Tax=Aeromonas popoffii TaxID=70856 RepID=UPI003F2D8693